MERHISITRAHHLKWVCNIDIETREHCGGKVKVITSIEDPPVIGKILALIQKGEQQAGMPSVQLD